METLEAVVDLLTTVAVAVALVASELARLHVQMVVQEFQMQFSELTTIGQVAEVPRATLTSVVMVVLAVAVEVLLAQLLVVLV
jgi:hypothetical protein